MTGTGTGAPELDGAPLFLLDELPEGEELLVDGAEGRHAVDVLRLAPGEQVRPRGGGGGVGGGGGGVPGGAALPGGPAGRRVRVPARHDVPAPQPELVLV